MVIAEEPLAPATAASTCSGGTSGYTSGSFISAVPPAAADAYVRLLLPYALSFAAGAMILVAVHELIPECQKNRQEQPYFATMGIILGFAAMMLLDVMLG